jgi:peptidyl-prolyl cis-trans isomerase B (cyclophilin B)
LRNLPKNEQDKLVIITTTEGKIVVDLYDETPLHKANFIKLVESNFYDSLLFHRVINGFMIQGGDPKSKDAAPNVSLGMGGPGYTIPAEFDTAFYHKKGVIAAARTVNPKKASSGSQFYLVQGKVYNMSQIKNMERRMKANNPEFKYRTNQIKSYTTIGGIPSLDGEYTVFGEIIYGLDVVDKIAKVQTAGQNRPVVDVFMEMETIERDKLNLKKL